MGGQRADRIIFVGGAPRSGTTVTHALICTSEQANDYNAEISFFRGLPLAYRNGRVAWRDHTSDFFREPEEFRKLMRQTTDLSLQHIWRHAGERPVLALKDPHLTPLFRDLHMLYPDEARFVVVVRHPCDVVRSRQEVHEKGSSQRPFAVGDVHAVAREYVNYYQAILTYDFAGHALVIRYESLGDPAVQAKIAALAGVSDFDVSKLWRTSSPEHPQDEWGSPKYYQALNLEPRLSPLNAEFAEATETICRPIMQRLGYE